MSSRSCVIVLRHVKYKLQAATTFEPIISVSL